MIPVADAINAITNDTADAEQQSLPGIVPPFNYEGAYLELEAKAVEVNRLRAVADDDAREARASRKQWEEAATAFSMMALEFSRRRKAKTQVAESASENGDGPTEPLLGLSDAGDSGE